MRLPRDIGGQALAGRLSRFGYIVMRQTGCHLRLVSNHTGREHHLTVPTHTLLHLGTLSCILTEVLTYLGIEKDALTAALFS